MNQGMNADTDVREATTGNVQTLRVGDRQSNVGQGVAASRPLTEEELRARELRRLTEMERNTPGVTSHRMVAGIDPYAEGPGFRKVTITKLHRGYLVEVGCHTFALTKDQLLTYVVSYINNPNQVEQDFRDGKLLAE
jgi:hypothetical protein